MKSSKTNKVHDWTHAHVARHLPRGRYFKYKCKRCGVHTLSGLPLNPPHNENCDPDWRSKRLTTGLDNGR